ncbi:MAG: hypothetical protein IKN48_02495 [Bacteroidaceae bacterium]|nr:hypothetical protein [Bacteroidaceae bacterium]
MAKKAVTVTLYMSEIIYEVENKTFLTGRARDNGQNFEESADMRANADDENRNQIIRSIGNAFHTLKTKVSEYLVESGTSSNNVQISDSTNLTVALQMPSNYNPATRDTISAALHQYIVNIAVAEWFNIFDKNDAGDYLNMAAANLTQLREALNKRVRPERTEVTTP